MLRCVSLSQRIHFGPGGTIFFSKCVKLQFLRPIKFFVGNFSEGKTFFYGTKLQRFEPKLYDRIIQIDFYILIVEPVKKRLEIFEKHFTCPLEHIDEKNVKMFWIFQEVSPKNTQISTKKIQEHVPSNVSWRMIE